MTMIRLVAELHDAGIRIALNGDKIRAEPTRGTIPQSFLQRLTDHKPALRALLTSPAGHTLRMLLDLAIDEGLPGAIVAGLSEKDLYTCDGLSRHTLAAFLRALARRLRRSAGRMDSPGSVRGMRFCPVMARRPGCRDLLLVVPPPQDRRDHPRAGHR